MCVGSGKAAQRAIEAQQQERERLITAGLGEINQAFSGFNPAFYAQAKNATLASLLPRLGDQYANALRSLSYSLANRGLTNSSSASRLGAELGKQYAFGQQDVANQALEAERQLRQEVAQRKATLAQQLQVSTDPTLAAQQAVEIASTIRAPSTVAPLGDFFSGVLNPMVAARTAQVYDPRVPSYSSRLGLGSLGTQPGYFVKGGK
jgi:hypothetical protein